MKMRILYVLFFFMPMISLAQDTIRLNGYAGNLKKIDIQIGGIIYSFLFDTGGGETLISPEIATALNKDVYGEITGFRMRGEMIKYKKCDSIMMQIGKTKIFHISAGVWDIMSVLPKDFPKLDGVLSLKSFQNNLITIDLANNFLIIETPASFKKQLKSKIAIPCRFATGTDGNELTIYSLVKQGKKNYWFLFDSGNLDHILLSHNTAKECKLQPDTSRTRKEFSQVTFPIGNNMVSSEAASENIIHDGVFSFELLNKFIFTIDFRNKQVWVAQN